MRFLNIEEIINSGISIDSRTIKRGEAFIAIKGKNYDGHSFIMEAVKKGASVVVLNFKPPRLAKKVPVIVVSDTITALGDIGAYRRKKFNIPVIGITGSNGKTTVKEMIAHILGGKFNVLKNRGTENNFIGLPLTLLRLKKSHNAVVCEIGANHTGEIDRLSQILKPTFGLITNIGPSHMEYFGDLKKVFKAKTEMLSYLSPGSVILNGDDRFLSRLKGKAGAATFGMGRGCDFRAAKINQVHWWTEFELNGKERFRLHLPGMHNVYNGLAAIAAASVFGVGLKSIKRRLSTFRPLPKRMRTSLFNGISIIDDTYNSNPLSAACAIRFLSDIRVKGKKIYVTGDMLELGKQAKCFHRNIGKIIANSSIDKLITVGELSRETHLAAQRYGMRNRSLWNCESTDEAASLLSKVSRSGDVVLIKGSRAMKMEKVIEKFKTKRGRFSLSESFM